MRSPVELVRTYLQEVAAGGRIDLIDELAHADMVDEANQAFGGPPGRDGLVAHVVGFRRNVTDLSITIDRIISGGADEAMAMWSFTGTLSGPWLGVTPTDGPVSGTVFSFFDFDDGRISRYRLWLHTDLGPPHGQVTFDSSNPTLPGR